jgi:ABC-2 type transport system permease protein
LGSSFMALGIFTSSLTQNQIVAAVLSFGALLMLWIIGWAKSYAGPGAAEVIEYLSIVKHFETFSKGVFDSRDFIYYLLFTVLFLFLTLKQMASYRWRG